MKIKDVKIERFGAWRGLHWTDLADEVNVLYGPNEAGKTTLMQFLRGVFFGYTDERRARYVPADAAGRAGGAVRVSHGEASMSVSRFADSAREPAQLLIADGRGSRRGSLALVELLGNVDEKTYSNVFAIGLREMQELGTLSDTDASHLLYDLTLGLDRVSLSEVMRELDAARNRLLSDEDRPSVVVQLLGQRDRLEAEIAELAELTPRYLELVAARDALNAQISQLESERTALNDRASALEAAGSLRERWERRAQLARQFAALPPEGRLPDDALARLDQLNVQLVARRKRVQQIRARRRKLHGDATALGVNEALCRQSARLDALREQEPWMSTLAAQSQSLRQEVGQLEQQLQQFGKTSASSGKSVPRIAPAAQSALRELGRSIRELTRQSREAEAALAQQQAAETKLAQELVDTGPRYSGKSLADALERQGELVGQLRRRIQIDEKLDKLSRRLSEAEAHGQELIGQQMLPPAALFGLGAFFVVGAGLVLNAIVGAVWTGSSGSSIGGSLVVGLVFMFASGMMKVYLEASAADELDLCQRHASKCRGQIKELSAEREALDALLPKGGGPFAARLLSAEKELANLEKIAPMESQRDEVDRGSRTLLERNNQTQHELKRAHERWRQTLRNAGLSEQLSPKQLQELLSETEQHTGLIGQLERKRQELADRDRQHEALAERIQQFALEVGFQAAAKDPVGVLRSMIEQQREHAARHKRRTALHAELTRLRQRQARAAHGLGKARRRRQRLLRRAGAADEAELRQRFELAAQRTRLHHEHRELDGELQLALAGHAAADEIRQALDTDRDLERAGRELAAALQTVKARLEQWFEQRGELSQKIKNLADDRRLANKRLELDAVEQRLGETLREWRTLAACSLMIEEVRRAYERERQPEALREASHYLDQLTAGRYRRIWTPLGRDVLHVEDSQGHQHEVEDLSHGTREQMFMALRMAMVSAFAARGVRLPMVLDDVFVNFDDDRTRLAAGVLLDFAQRGHQLLIFTCHEHVARVFHELRADVRQLPAADAPHRWPALSWVRQRPAEPVVVPPPAAPPAVQMAVALPVAEEIVLEPRRRPQTAWAIPEIIAESPPEPVVQPRPRRARSYRPRRPRPTRETSRYVTERFWQSDWSAEEFSGELRDQVRSGAAVEERRGMRGETRIETSLGAEQHEVSREKYSRYEPPRDEHPRYDEALEHHSRFDETFDEPLEIAPWEEEAA